MRWSWNVSDVGGSTNVRSECAVLPCGYELDSCMGDIRNGRCLRGGARVAVHASYPFATIHMAAASSGLIAASADNLEANEKPAG